MESNDSRLGKSKDFWTYLDDNYKEVSNWPTWMRGESSSSCVRSKPNQTERDEKKEESNE